MDAEQEQLINAETPVLDIVFRHIYFLRISQTVISRLLGRYDLTDRKKYNRHSRTSSMLAPNTTTALCLLSPFGTALTRTYNEVRVKNTLHERE